MQKTTIFTLTLLFLAILPAMAQVQTSGLGQVWTDFKSYSTDLQDYLQYNLSDNLKPVEVQSQNALSNAKGDLNLPNPVAAGKTVRDNLINYSYNSDSKSTRFENNSAVRGNLVSNELNRVITRGVAVGVLGKNGQIRTKIKLENTENTLKNIADITDQAEVGSQGFIDKARSLIPTTPSGVAATAGDIATTGAISALSQLIGATQLESIKIQQAQSQIVGETFAQTIQTNQSLQYSNLNLANISQQTEEANRARRVETSTEAARLLRATSQLDLFGRKVYK
ncbi:MAG: hypothetical protein HWQ38_30230 [Nostoc sp. NMS7]|uniref:hypothetical protein n=1 Tax=Nostoc sp. NMS7 TaxID=2815391 RepID=UPI0025CBA299|nr:hypothetical protein [Nostoc sp. NMS7]MBN3950515.1 hypothetical protein [Nostoc sp. NMS7]